MNNFGEKVSFIWSVADLLRGPYRPNQYSDVPGVTSSRGFQGRGKPLLESVQ